MGKDNFERQIKTKLDSWEVTPPADMWNRIQKELPSSTTPAARNIIYRPIFWGAAAAAAMLAGIILWFAIPTDNVIPNQMTAHSFTQNTTTNSAAYPQTKEEQGDNFPTHQPILAEVTGPSRKNRQNTASNENEQPVLASARGTFFPASFEKRTAQPSSTRTASGTRADNNGIRVNTYSSNYFIDGNNTGNSYYEDIPQRKHRSGKYTVGIMAVNPVSRNSTTTNRHSSLTKSFPFTASLLSANNPNKEDLEWNHNVPLTFGITVEKRISPSIGIETGITYSFLKSTYKNVNRSRYGNQELHYIGIPITGIYRFARWNNFSFYSAIGGKVDFNVAGNRTDRVNADYEGFRFQGDIEANTTKSIRDKKAQFSLTCKLGTAYAFVDYLEMYAEPGLAYYFNNGNSEVQNMWKDKPLNFALQVGLRTNF